MLHASQVALTKQCWTGFIKISAQTLEHSSSALSNTSGLAVEYTQHTPQCLTMHCILLNCSIFSSHAGLLLGTDAPVMMPNKAEFLFPFLLAGLHFRLVTCEDLVPFCACAFRTSTSSLALANTAVSRPAPRSPKSMQADNAAAHYRPRLFLYEYCIPALIVSALVGYHRRFCRSI